MSVSKLIIAAAAALLMPAALAASTPFSYNRCATNGPSAWQANACQTGVYQTPIDVCGATAFPGTAPTPTCSAAWGVAQFGSISNNGHTVQVNVNPASGTEISTNFGNLGSIVVHPDASTNALTQRNNRTYVLEQLHFHWGRTGLTNEGSEHYYQGVAYPLEVHFVHYNAFCATSVGTAVANCADGEALMVVGILFAVGTTESAALTAIGLAAPGATGTKTTMTTATDLSQMWSCSGDYYSYAGGLTTPPCVEIVTWINVAAISTITSATLERIKGTYEDPGTNTVLIAVYGNFRPLYPKAGRALYSSAGTTTACGTVTAPTFTCSSAATRFGATQVGLVLLAGILGIFAH